MKTREDPNCVNISLHQCLKLVLSGPTATKSSKAIQINKKMILYFKCHYCHESSK